MIYDILNDLCLLEFTFLPLFASLISQILNEHTVVCIAAVQIYQK